MKLKFMNHATLLGFIFVLVQQIIVASSTVMIAMLSQAVMTGYNYGIWLVLFIASLTIVYIPTTITNYFINKAKYITYTRFIETFKCSAYNHPAHFYNSRFRQEREAYFTHEAWMITQENYNFFIDMGSLVLNVCLNIVVLCYYLNKAFLYSYACAIPLTIICVMASKNSLQKRSDKSKQSRSAMLQTLNSGWDTILTGNKWNVSVWLKNFANKSHISDQNQRELSLNIDIASTVTLLVSALPIMITLFISFTSAIGNVEMLALLVATTPRQVTTLQHLSDVIGLFINMNDKLRRTKQIAIQLDFTRPLLNSGKINWGKVYIMSSGQKEAILSFNDLTVYTNNYTNGRFTVLGDNGSGKTTLFANIKETLGDKAFLLPSQSKVIFANDISQLEFSTGEKTIANLQEIANDMKNTEISVLLLDEWNANLDRENIKRLNDLIDSLSSDFCVIEVLHNV